MDLWWLEVMEKGGSWGFVPKYLIRVLIRDVKMFLYIQSLAKCYLDKH